MSKWEWRLFGFLNLVLAVLVLVYIHLVGLYVTPVQLHKSLCSKALTFHLGTPAGKPLGSIQLQEQTAFSCSYKAHVFFGKECFTYKGVVLNLTDKRLVLRLTKDRYLVIE